MEQKHLYSGQSFQNMRIVLIQFFPGIQQLSDQTFLVDQGDHQLSIDANLEKDCPDTYVKTPETGTTHFWTPMGGVSIALSSPRKEALLLKSGSLRLLIVAMSIMSTSVVFPPEKPKMIRYEYKSNFVMHQKPINT